MKHLTNENFLNIQNDLGNESVQDFANRLEQIYQSMDSYNSTHVYIRDDYELLRHWDKRDELYPYDDYRGYAYSYGELTSPLGKTETLPMEEQIKMARLLGTLGRPINLDAVDTFPFNICDSQWIYISYKSNNNGKTVEYDTRLFNKFLVSIVNHASLGLVFSYSNTTYIGTSSYSRFSDTYIEYLLCFDKETNIRIVVESLRCDLFALGLIPSNIKILTKSEEIASFFKGDYLFEVYPGLHYFYSRAPCLFVFQIRYSILEYYCFFCTFRDKTSYFSTDIRKVPLNEYILFGCYPSISYNRMFTSKNVSRELLSRIDSVLHKYLSGFSYMLFHSYIFIPFEYKERHLIDENYTILNDYNNVNSFIQIYFKKAHER